MGLPDPAAAMNRAVMEVGQTIRAKATLMGYSACFSLLGLVLVGSVVSVALLEMGPRREDARTDARRHPAWPNPPV